MANQSKLPRTRTDWMLVGIIFTSLGILFTAKGNPHAIGSIVFGIIVFTIARAAPQKPQQTTRRRQPLTEAVKHEVWRRDQGRCVECGSRQLLEYDHIHPWSLGGPDTVRNIELLCQTCNRRKGARV